MGGKQNVTIFVAFEGFEGCLNDPVALRIHFGTSFPEVARYVGNFGL